MDRLPYVSVIVPVLNERPFLPKVLGSLLEQDYPPDRFEVLIVDGGSSDGSQEVVAEFLKTPEEPDAGLKSASNVFSETLRPTLILLKNPNRGAPSGLNLGIEQAKGGVLFRLDGHSTMARNYLRTCVQELADRPEVAAVGGLSIAQGRGVIGGAYAAVLRSPFGVGKGTFRTHRCEAFVDTLAFCGYRKTVFETCGTFNEDLVRNQDIEFNQRVRRHCGPLLLTPSTYTRYLAPDTLRGVAVQNFRNGYWNLKEIAVLAKALSPRHFVPLCTVFLLVLLLTLTFVYPVFGWVLAACGLAYLGITLQVALSRSETLNWRERALIPPLLGLTHGAYGVGSWFGLVRAVVNRVETGLRSSRAPGSGPVKGDRNT